MTLIAFKTWRQTRSLLRLRRSRVARKRLQHARPISLGIRERDVLAHSGYLHRLAEHFAACFRDLPDRLVDIVHRDDDGRMLRRPIRLPREEAAVDRAGLLRSAVARFRRRGENVIAHLLTEHLRLPAKGR